MDVVEQTARALARRARRTYERVLYIELRLIKRFVRRNFPSWIDYYG